MKKVILSTLIILLANTILAQTKTKVASGTFYLMFITCIPRDCNRPLSGYALASQLPQKINTESYKDFVCSIYYQSVFSLGPDVPSLSIYTSKDSIFTDSTLAILDSQTVNLNNCRFKDEFVLPDSTIVYLYISKFIGSMSVETGKKDFLTNRKKGPFLDIDYNCYAKDYYYSFAGIDSILPFDKNEWYKIKKKLTLLKD